MASADGDGRAFRAQHAQQPAAEPLKSIDFSAGCPPMNRIGAAGGGGARCVRRAWSVAHAASCSVSWDSTISR